MSLRKDYAQKYSLTHNCFTGAFLWGGLWGLSEATFGHILHAVRIPGLAGFVMFPAGVFFMLKAYRDTNRMSVIFSTALVAASIKLSNLLLPGTSALDILRPAMAILTESLGVIAFLSFIETRVFRHHLIQR